MEFYYAYFKLFCDSTVTVYIEELVQLREEIKF